MNLAGEHTKNKDPSTSDKHQKGQTRSQADKARSGGTGGPGAEYNKGKGSSGNNSSGKSDSKKKTWWQDLKPWWQDLTFIRAFSFPVQYRYKD